MNQHLQITFDPDGTAQYVGGEQHAAAELLAGSIDDVEQRRASHVEPCNWFLRLAFHAVRLLADDASRLAAWTRGWPCLWRVNVVGGPTWRAYADRAEAIRDEIEWLENNRL